MQNSAEIIKCATLAGLIATSNISARQYTVAQDGSGDFTTISEAAAAMTSGDICYVHKGVYRETISPPSGVTIAAAAGESVTIHAGDAVSGWQPHSGNIYKAAVSGKVKDVFVDDVYMCWARSPNLHYRPGLGFDYLDATTGGPCPSGDVSGAIAQQGGGWVWEAFPATMCNGDVYILYGAMGSLDSEGEWCHKNGELYLYAPGGANPSTLTVDAKKRDHCVDLAGKNNVTIKGFRMLGGDVHMPNSQGCLIDECQILWPSSIFWTATRTSLYYPKAGWGVLMNGSDCELRNSEVAHTWSDGVHMEGSNNRVVGCHIWDCGWSGADGGTINFLNSNNCSVRYSKLHDCGRHVIMHKYASKATIEYNEIYNAGRLTHDLGVIYAFGTNGNGTVIAYNWIHDNQMGPGVYNDNFCEGFIIHHNVIWDVGSGVRLNGPTKGIRVYNNTLFNCGDVGSGTYTWPEPGCGPGGYSVCSPTYEYEAANNLYLGSSPASQLANPSEFDFSLKPGAAAIDAGKVISGITDGYTGSAPDLGAYESGANYWRPARKPGEPVARFSADKYAGERPLAVNFDASESFDDDGSIASYTWDFGDGETGTGKTVSHTYNKAHRATYTVTLTVQDNDGKTGTASGQIRLVGLKAAETVENASPGIECSYYEGSWTALPDFSSLTPKKSALVSAFDLSLAQRANEFALTFSGFVKIPADGEYTFYLASDDGSELRIGNEVIISNDGMHAMEEKKASIGLKAGLHSIAVGYFEASGGSGLTVSIEGPGTKKQEIGADILFNGDRKAVAGKRLQHLHSNGINVSRIGKLIRVSINNPGIRHIAIIRPDGRTMLSKQISARGSFEFSTAQSAGAYLVKVDGGRSRIIKVIGW